CRSTQAVNRCQSISADGVGTGSGPGVASRRRRQANRKRSSRSRMARSPAESPLRCSLDRAVAAGLGFGAILYCRLMRAWARLTRGSEIAARVKQVSKRPMAATLSPTSTVQRSEEQIAAAVDDEIIILSVERGSYFGLDDIGSDIWERL